MSETTKAPFRPPSLPETNRTATFTYHHVPGMMSSEPVMLGVDEAGRGPVLGPMVYAVAYCPLSYGEELASHGYDDSKVLNADVRYAMFKDVLDEPKRGTIGWATTVMTAVDIGDGMLRPEAPYNLNDQAHDTTIALIQGVLDAHINVKEVYVDTVGPPEKYQSKLARRFPEIPTIVVTKKADSLYPIVSLASICAKVTRDMSLEEQLGDNCGSGYPSDPNTTRWLNANLDPVFGWGPMVRYSWGTAKTVLENSGHKVVWKADAEAAEERKQMLLGIKRPIKSGLPKVGLSFYGERA